MRERIQRDPPQPVRRVVALSSRLPGVGDFVDHDGADQDGDENDDVDDVHGRLNYLSRVGAPTR